MQERLDPIPHTDPDANPNFDREAEESEYQKNLRKQLERTKDFVFRPIKPKPKTEPEQTNMF
jgi:hypothetical protein